MNWPLRTVLRLRGADSARRFHVIGRNFHSGEYQLIEHAGDLPDDCDPQRERQYTFWIGLGAALMLLEPVT